MYPHERNLIGKKTSSSYSHLSDKLDQFIDAHYMPFREKVMRNYEISFEAGDDYVFDELASELNNYKNALEKFASDNSLTSQSKFVPTLLEEISTYLLSSHSVIREHGLVFDNKKIFTNIAFDRKSTPQVLYKDVDFCVGKPFDLTVGKKTYQLFMPIICVEAKTYLDGTMINEVLYSSELIRQSHPQSKRYVIMERNEVGQRRLDVDRYNPSLDQMFVLCEDGSYVGQALHTYFGELHAALCAMSEDGVATNNPVTLLR